MNPNWQEIRREWEATNATFKELADKHSIKDATIRSRKNREQWQRNATSSNATQRKNVATKKQGAVFTKSEESLTDKQRLFVREYLVDLNATQAAIRAGYSADTAEQQASRLLSNVKVQEAIQKAMYKREQRIEITADRVLEELAKIGFANMQDYVEWGRKGVRLRESSELTPAQAAAISEVSETITESGGSLKFKLHSKIVALERIGKHLGMFDDKANKDKVDPNAQITALADLINNPAPERVMPDD